MNKRMPLIVAGIIFTIVALIHLLRLYNQWEITVAGVVIPMSVSQIGLGVTAVLALWMFIAAKKN